MASAHDRVGHSRVPFDQAHPRRLRRTNVPRRRDRVRRLLCLLLLVLAAPAWAQSELQVGTVTAGPGDEVFLPVDFVTDGSVVALQFDLIYDSGVLDVTDTAPGAALVDHALDAQPIAPGRLRLVVTANSLTPLAPGRLLDLRVAVDPLAAPGDYPLVFEAVRLADAQAQPLQPDALVDGRVRVAAPPSPPPPAAPGAGDGAGAVPVPGLSMAGLAALFMAVLALAWLFLRHGARGVALSVMTASVLLSSVVRAQVLPGDANADGEVNAQDIPFIVDEIQERQDAPGDADCTMDGAVDVLDAVCVLQPGDDPDPDPNPDNRPPQLDALSDRLVRVGDAVSLVATATDPDLPDDRLAWSLSQGPVGTSLAQVDGALLWIPSDDHVGDNPFTVRVTDAAGAWDERSFVVQVSRRGNPPRLEALTDVSLTVGDSLDLLARASDPDLPDDQLTFALELAPAGLLLDPDTGRLTWVPDAGQVGFHDVSLTVADQDGLQDFTGFTVGVFAANRPPEGSADLFTVEIGGVLAVDAPGVLDNDSDPDGDALSAVLLDGPQNGDLAFDADGGFEYQSRRPEPLDGDPPYLENVNLSLEAVPTLEPFNVSHLRHLERIVDGDPSTSGSAPGGFYHLPLEVRFDAEDVTVREVRIFGDRLADTAIADNTEAQVRLLDRNGDELYHSGAIALSLPDRDAVLTLDPPVAGVHVLEYRATAWDGPGGQGFILGELEILGDGTRQRLPMVEEWHWDGEGTERPDQENVQATPVVIDLDDDEVPEVVFAAGLRAISRPMGWVQILDGATGEEKFPSAFCSEVATHMAGGDIDGDGFNEVIAVAGEPLNGICQAPNPYRLRAIAHDGTEKWLSEPIERPAGWGAAIVLADLDGDGTSEILHGRQALDHEGRLLWTAEGVLANSYLPEVADIDLDGEVEVVYGGSVYDRFGVQEWTTSFNKDWAAIANFDDDPFAEIFVNGPNRSQLYEHDGQVAWASSYISGGPPTVGDFDADGAPEIGFARGSDYVVLETDGSLKWSRRIKDGSSGRTGSSLFDFDGDGRMEVVQSDEAYFRIWDGATGNVRFRVPLTSITNTELPLVADVDGDGQAEVLVPANGWPEPGTEGVYVFGGAEDDFVRARPIWNQHGYHVTNVMPDGRIPADEPQNWLVSGLNHHRVNDFLPDERARADRFTYAAHDGELASEPVEVFIDIVPERFPPVITSLPVDLASPGFEYFYDVQAEDRNKDLLTFGLAGAPAGMTIDAGTGLLRWMPGEDDLGRHLVDIRVSDPDGAEAIQAFFLEVLPAVAVPDVVGETEDDAATLLEAATLSPGRTSTAFDPSVPPNHVAQQQPPAGSVAPAGARVDLVLSLGAGPQDTDDDGDGYSENQGDCDDGDDSLYPGADDTPGDDIDQDCDGFDATEPLSALLVAPGALDLLVGQSAMVQAWGAFPDGSAQPVTSLASWSSNAPAIATISAAGEVSAVSPGTAVITANLGDESGQVTVEVTAVDLQDDQAPVVRLIAPADGAHVAGPVDVIGTVNDDALYRWELSMLRSGDAEASVLATGEGAVQAGTLGQIDPTLMRNGAYTLRLAAFDRGGNISADQLTVLLDGEMKVGHFTLTFEDLNVPVGGVPLTVNRVYDSRDKRVGDFGTGWRLGFDTVEVSCSADLSSGWYVQRAGMSFRLQATRPHTCMILIPGQRPIVFDLVTTPSVSPIVPFPPFAIQTGLVPREPAFGTLEILGNRSVSIFDPQPGPATLADDLTGLPWVPDRFVYRTLEGTEFTLSRNHGLERIRDANGNTVTIGSDGVTHSAGRSISFERNPSGRIVALSDPMGGVQHYDYDRHGDLSRHTDAVGGATRYRYDIRRNLVNVTDALGARAIVNEYDDQGRLIATTDANGHRTEFAVDLDARQFVTTDPNGHQVVRSFDESGNVLTEQRTLTIEGVPTVALTTNSYDPDGNQTATVDPDGVRNTYDYDADRNLTRLTTQTGAGEMALSLAYDDQGRVTSRTEFSGETTLMTYDVRGNLTERRDAFGAVTRHAYDASGRRVVDIDPNGNRHETRYTGVGLVRRRDKFDASGQHLFRMDYDHDANGRLIATTAYVDPENGLGPVIRTYAYDASGRRVLATDAAGNEWRYEYDAAGQRVAEIDPFGQRTEYRYDPAGRVIATRFADGTQIRSEYDAFGNEVRSVGPAGQVTLHEYDEAGRRVATVSPDGHRIEMVYTPGGRLSAVIDQSGARTDYEYDDAGRIVNVIGPSVEVNLSGVFARPQTRTQYDGNGNVAATIDANGFVTGFAYDPAGRETGRVFPDGATISQSHDANANVNRTVDPLGLATEYRFDGLDRLVRVEQPPASPGDPVSTVSTSAYDPLGNRIAQQDALGRLTRFTYNPLGEVTSRVLPGGQSEHFIYERGLRLSESVDFNGSATTIEYDAMHRAVRRTYGGGLVEEFAYTPTGQVASATADTGTTFFDYDELDRLVEIRQAAGATVAYAYTPRGEVATLTVDGRELAAYAYDALGRLVEVQTGEGTTRYGYDLAGNQTVVESANGTRTMRAFDSMRRLSRIQEIDASGVLVQQLDYTRDERGMRVATDELNGSRETYGYDQLNRLISRERTGVGAISEQFEFDAVGNRTRVIDATGDRQFSYDSNDRLYQAGDASLAYDAAGNRTRFQSGNVTTDYEWNDRGLLSAVETNGQRTEFGYDALGNRVEQRGDFEALDFVVDMASVTGLNQVVEHRDPAGDVLGETVFGTQPLHARAGGEVRFLHTDTLGSITLTTDADGGAAEPHRFASFGRAETPEAAQLPLGFTGQQFDRETGLQYLRARYYDPGTGVFLSEDPLLGNLADPVTRHRYLYAASNPVNFIDPTGEYSLASLSVSQSISNVLKATTAAGLFCSALGATENTATLKALFNLAVTGAKYANSGSLPKDATATLLDIDDPSSRVGIQKLKVELTAKGVMSVSAKSDGKPEVRFKLNLKTGRVYGKSAGEFDATLVKLRKCGGGVDVKLELLAEADGKVGKVSDLDFGAQADSPTGFRVIGEFILGPASIKKWTFAEVPPDGIESLFRDIENRKTSFILSRYQLNP